MRLPSPTSVASLVRRQRLLRGQALVETALLLPLLLILLLGAIDFGRVFFGWVNLHQAARIGANYAATHQLLTEFDQDDYEALIEGDLGAVNCEVQDPLPNPTYTTPEGTPTGSPQLGDFANVDLECAFSLITPMAGLFAGPIEMTAQATFPIREGCVNCGATAPAPPPATPVQCHEVPEMALMSVAGARLAWESAGFLPENFNPETGSDTLTVDDDPQPIIAQPPLSTCIDPFAQFDSEVTVTTVTPEPESPGCATVPNLVGLSVADARDAWDEDFDVAAFGADDADDQRRVVSQATTPGSTPGVTCLALDASVSVTTGEPWPAPPPVPCKVPNLIDLKRVEGRQAWSAADFTGVYEPSGGPNFVIKSQSLVGGTWLPCEASITVSANP